MASGPGAAPSHSDQPPSPIPPRSRSTAETEERHDETATIWTTARNNAGDRSCPAHHPTLPAQAAGAANLAAGKATSSSGFTDVYPTSNITDGNQPATGRAPTTPSRSGFSRPGCRDEHRLARAQAPPRVGSAHPDPLGAGRPDQWRAVVPLWPRPATPSTRPAPTRSPSRQQRVCVSCG